MSPLEVLLLFLLEFSEGLVPVRLNGRWPLYRQDYMKITVPTRYQCMELCIAMKLCRNISFRESNRMCFMNTDDQDRQSTWRSGNNDIPISKKDIPQELGGGCGDHTCAIDETCVVNGVSLSCVEHDFPTVKCPINWARREDTCFCIFLKLKSWTEAKDHCTGIGGELLNIYDKYNYYKNTIIFRLSTNGKRVSGKVWTGVQYPSDIPNSMPISSAPTNDSNLCLGLRFKKTKGQRLGPWEPVSCDEKNEFVCQMRSPDHWT